MVHLHTHGVACESTHTCVPSVSPPCHPSPDIVSIYSRWMIFNGHRLWRACLLVKDIWKHMNSLCPSFMNIIVFALPISLAIYENFIVAGDWKKVPDYPSTFPSHVSWVFQTSFLLSFSFSFTFMPLYVFVTIPTGYWNAFPALFYGESYLCKE